MHRLLSFAAALATSTLLLATAANAGSPAYYTATPAAQPAKTSLMTRSTMWNLRGSSFVAARAPERDAVLCQLVARDVGQLSAFTAGDKAYDADALAKCNAHAKGGAAIAVASR